MLAKKGRIAWRLIAVRALETHAFAELFDPSNCNLWTIACLNLRQDCLECDYNITLRKAIYQLTDIV